MATVPFTAGPAVLQAAIAANLTGPTGAVYEPSVSLEKASSTTRSYLITFPRDLGNVATMVGYGTSEISAVNITQEAQGSMQVS